LKIIKAMSQKMILSFVAVFLTPCVFVFADPMINEIMYDLEGSDAGREWIEIYNSGKDAVDLSEYKFFEAGVNHKLVLAQGSSKLEPFHYALIVSNVEKFKESYPSLSGNIFKSNFSLSNTGESLALKDKDLNIADQIVYSSSMGGAGNGMTISKIDGAWREGRATPGAENEIHIPPKPKTTPVSRSVPEKNLTPKISIPPQPEAEAFGVDLGGDGLPAQAGDGNSISILALESEIITTSSNNGYMPMLIFLALIGVSASAVYIIRKKKVSAADPEDDFTILDD
jgi:hypothetical protein